jgi:molecular chaperone DnaJ
MVMDLYAVLGLARGAGAADIRRAYRRLARQYHPGINPGDHEAAARFSQITLAFETLNDPERRRAYDLGERLGGGQAEPVSFGFEGFDFSVNVTGEHEASTFGELFADVLARGPGEGPEDGADIHVTLSLSFEAAMAGGESRVTVNRSGRCRICGGGGVVRAEPAPCGVCQGTGRVRWARGHMVFTKPCDACRGSGQQRECVCRACGGSGVEARVEGLSVSVPAGVVDGVQLRVPGGGHAGRRGGRPGDLFVVVQVEPHRLFRREGNDLHLQLPIAVHEAALGAKIDIPTLDGPVKLRVPPGTQSGQRLRLRERGAPSMRPGVRGDLIVEVRLVMPPLLDERSRELMREFARINADDVRQGLWTPEPKAGMSAQGMPDQKVRRPADV